MATALCVAIAGVALYLLLESAARMIRDLWLH
jgi:hypothetical protein